MNSKSETICPICLEILETPQLCQLNPCKHSFCYNCITNWTKKSLRCPLCQDKPQSFTKGFDSGFSEEDFKEPVKTSENASSEEVDREAFACLDHDYFISEFAVLMDKINEKELSFSSFSSRGSLSKQQERSFTILQNIKLRAKKIIQSLKDGELFVAFNLLKDLQSWDESVGKINPLSSNFEFDKIYKNSEADKEEEMVHEDFTMASILVVVPGKKKSKKKRAQLLIH